ncbi:MAG: DUF763 domain-containing protein [Desulfotomaculaceae bacterium]|nr:DUF763 domain-containing protein [Desulfotomaculaceae bacterium]
MRTGIANLPLHGHHCPRWLFDRMVKLSSAIVEAVVEEYGPGEVLKRFSDPFWFQALGCVVGFDWHSSGLTTVLCGALKEGLRSKQQALGLYLAGGKAMASRKTPLEIEEYAERYALQINVGSLQYASRMSAKVDSAAIQDGYQIYHHVFAFTADGRWAVVQQGMDQSSGWARRYHWLGDEVDTFIQEPHAAVCGQPAGEVLNMVAGESANARDASLYLAGRPAEVVSVLKKLSGLSAERLKVLDLPAVHPVPQAGRIEKTLARLYDIQPSSYERLLAVAGVGPATVRAFALVSEVVYNTGASRNDPVRYSFAHGGKDGHPFPVNQQDYDRSITMLENALRRAKTGDRSKMEALKRLSVISNYNKTASCTYYK